jgi:hypothetical protein
MLRIRLSGPPKRRKQPERYTTFALNEVPVYGRGAYPYEFFRCFRRDMKCRRSVMYFIRRRMSEASIFPHLYQKKTHTMR